MRFHRDCSAVTAIEYALLAALIAVVIIGSVTVVGSQVLQMYNNIKDQVVLAMQ
ncbi:Flp family type IVb pilin [Rugamonas apoptosis]|uniref:Flp family type IVb pilin n=1 Tax=Rugamonas apoptosis TaxID=2758570 RepID=A0A7W2F6V2_9BURK|nr:Flp family type IVb pilin [Rugamonas apoptosis]MBA5686212.1 Flp family type IVb pilin [Rugamonas apoptosis]